MNTKFFAMMVAGAALSLPVWSQVEEQAEMAFSELDEGTATASIEEKVSVKAMISDFMNHKAWDEGRNEKKDGSTFIIATGSSVIQAPRGHRAYINARQIAFDKALADGKSSLLRYLESEVSTDIKMAALQGEFPSPEIPEEQLSLRQKMLALAHAILDEKLAEKGIAKDDPEAEEVITGVLNSEEFSNVTRSASESFLAGFQAYKTFESTPKGKKGRMGVILLWSPKLNEMAASIKTGQAMSTGKAKRTLREQVQVDPVLLLSTFGIQQTRDENGNYWLLASGQSGLQSESAMSEDMAEEQARTIAESYIRQFAGENAKRVTDMYQAESYKELVTGAEIYQNESALKKEYESHAKAMKIQGMKVLRRWQTVHPLTGQSVVGVVVAWSPVSAQHAGSTTQSMKDARDNPSAKGTKKTKENGSFGGSGGFGGDEDDF